MTSNDWKRVYRSRFDVAVVRFEEKLVYRNTETDKGLAVVKRRR